MRKIQAIVILIVAIIIGILLLNTSTLMSFFKKSSESEDYSNESYTELTIREGDTTPIEFGDTEYSLHYAMSYLNVYAPFQSETFIPSEGETFKDLGIEIKVSKRDSDYISEYIVIKVRPTVDNYMFSKYRYTKVDIPINDMRTVNISSGLINKTNSYTFAYLFAPSGISGATLGVRNDTHHETYQALVNYLIPEAENNFDIEIRVYKAESDRLVIYVKPLY
jgi:hypothetical protein